MYDSANVAVRIKEMAKARKITLSTVFLDSGLGRNTMANLKTSMIAADSLAKIADCLDCSVDYLLGRTDDPQSHRKEHA